MPFLSETMYQNLVRGAPQAKEGEVSVHHCDFPVADESLIDEQLSADMESLLRLVSVGVRNGVKVKIRQPLAEMKVLPGSDGDRRAVSRFSGQICEELNVKKVTLHEPQAGRLLQQEVKPNLRRWAPGSAHR